jgi:hypothetical protein
MKKFTLLIALAIALTGCGGGGTSSAEESFVSGDGSTTLNSLLSSGQSATVAFLVTNGGTASYPTAFQVDGASVTPKFQGGAAFSAGNASSIDSYSFTVIKTAGSAFTVLASQTQFK